MLMIHPIEQKAKRDITGTLVAAIQQVLDSADLEDLSESQIEHIAKSYYIDALKQEFGKEVKKAKLKKEELVDQWLSGFTSKHTVRSFKKNLDLFLIWLNGKSLMDVDASVVDKYVTYLNSDKKLSANSKRQRIAACSSFFSDLERWRVIDKNPFKNAKNLPRKKISIKSADKIPSNTDLDHLEAYALNQIQQAREVKDRGYKKQESGNIYAYCALKMLRRYGLRVGALNSLKIDRKGNYRAISKTSEINGKLDSEIIQLFKSYGLDGSEPFKNYKESSFSVWLWRALSTSELKENVSCKFSPHAIRHRFAIDFYNRTKDVNQLSKLLGHSSLLVTTAYLAGLKTELV